MELSEVERRMKMVLVKSDVWSQPDGSARWTIRHLTSGTMQSGISPSVPAAYDDMNKVIKGWQAEMGEPGPVMTVIRPVEN